MKMTPMEIMEDTVEGVSSTMVATEHCEPAYGWQKYISLERVLDYAKQPATQPRERSL